VREITLITQKQGGFVERKSFLKSKTTKTTKMPTKISNFEHAFKYRNKSAIYSYGRRGRGSEVVGRRYVSGIFRVDSNGNSNLYQ